MWRFFIFIILLTGGGTFRASAFQHALEIARIDDHPITSDELLYAFNKTRSQEAPVHPDSLRAYLNQYIDFKLKVLAARQKGIDTTSSFIREYEGYIAQVKKPYMSHTRTNDELIAEAYERLQYEVRAAHILIKLPPDASPADTLHAYQKSDSLRTLTIRGGDFQQLAVTNSHDGSARNGGDLGWFTALDMVYPFENAVYTTRVGETSPVFRTSFGYHIVRVLGKRAARGKVKTSHIFISKNRHPTAKGAALAQKVYDSLNRGGDWHALCRAFSEDSRTRMTGGSLPLAGVGELPHEYLEVAFGLENTGDYSKPTATPYGWHIVRLEAKRPLPPLKKIYQEIAARVKRSDRNLLDQQGLIKKLKKENGFNPSARMLKAVADRLVKDGLSDDLTTTYRDEKLFSIGSKTVRFQSFFDRIAALDKPYRRAAVQKAYEAFENEQIIGYEDSMAVFKYPEYKFLLQEYKEGLMLFEVMKDEVWDKALSDSAGLEKYFSDRYIRYPAPERAETYLIETAHKEVLKSTNQLLRKSVPDNMTVVQYLKQQLDAEAFALLKIAKRTFERNELPIFATNNWKPKHLIAAESGTKVYWIDKILPSGYYDLHEIKGLVIADYQDYLEKRWVEKLRKQHKITINKKNLKKLLTLE